jgi:hypothetical protein
VLSVVLLLAPGADRPALRSLVTDHVAATYGALTRLCPMCASATHGRPHVTDRHDLHLSFAYADGLAVVAVADHPLGVDIEAEGGRRVPVGHADLAAWTRTEAAVKLAGTGIRGEPPPGAHVVDLTDLPEGYVGALATWRGQPGNGGSAASYSQGRSSAATS